jgi:hypothetical protein
MSCGRLYEMASQPNLPEILVERLTKMYNDDKNECKRVAEIYLSAPISKEAKSAVNNFKKYYNL